MSDSGETLREQINRRLRKYQRKAIALAVGVHLSTLNNALNGYRSSPAHVQLLKSVLKYLDDEVQCNTDV